MRTEPSSWQPIGEVDLANEAEVSAWAARLRLTASELREIIDEMGDRAAYGATEAGVSMPTLREQDRHGARPVGSAE
jgi:hypothetical protein